MKFEELPKISSGEGGGVERVMSASEKLDIVLKNPKVVHLTKIENLEPILVEGVLSEEFHQRLGRGELRLDMSRTTQEFIGRNDVVSVFDEANYVPRDTQLPSSWESDYLASKSGGFTAFSNGLRVALLLNPGIKRENTIHGFPGEGLIAPRVKPEDIFAIGVHEDVTDFKFWDFLCQNIWIEDPDSLGNANGKSINNILKQMERVSDGEDLQEIQELSKSMRLYFEVKLEMSWGNQAIWNYIIEVTGEAWISQAILEMEKWRSHEGDSYDENLVDRFIEYYYNNKNRDVLMKIIESHPNPDIAYFAKEYKTLPGRFLELLKKHLIKVTGIDELDSITVKEYVQIICQKNDIGFLEYPI